MSKMFMDITVFILIPEFLSIWYISVPMDTWAGMDKFLRQNLQFTMLLQTTLLCKYSVGYLFYAVVKYFRYSSASSFQINQLREVRELVGEILEIFYTCLASRQSSWCFNLFHPILKQTSLYWHTNEEDII